MQATLPLEKMGSSGKSVGPLSLPSSPRRQRIHLDESHSFKRIRVRVAAKCASKCKKRAARTHLNTLLGVFPDIRRPRRKSGVRADAST